MPTARDDFLLRLIARIAAVLRRLREQVDGGAAPEDVAREARAAAAELLADRGALLALLDAPSAVQLLGDAERVTLWVGLLRVEADAYERLGDLPRVTALRERASALEQASAVRRG